MGRFFQIPALFSALSVDEGGGDGEAFVEDGDVGDVTGLESSEPFESEVLGLVEGGGADEFGERTRDFLDDVAEGDVELEGGAGEGAVGGESGGAVGDDDGKAAELVVAVGESGGLHAVGDEEDAVDGLGLEGEADHVRAEMDLVADHLDVDVVAVESGADESDFAVVELGHLVAEVGEPCEPLLLSELELGHGGVGVAAAGDDMAADEFGCEVDGTFDLDGVGDEGDGRDGPLYVPFIYSPNFSLSLFDLIT